MKKICVLLTLLLLIGAMWFCPDASADDPDIKFKDYGGIISDSAKNYINNKNNKLFDYTGAAVMFVTVESTEGITAQEYCENMYSELDLKRLGRGNSVLCVVAPKEKDYGFCQGANIHLTLTDAMLDEFIVEHFEPDFQKKHYDGAVLKMFNALAGWYESEYTGLKLGLDNKTYKYTGGSITRDIMAKPNRILMWIGLGVGFILLIIILKIKRNIDLQIRQHERRKLKKKYKIDIDKIVNS